MRTQTPAGCDSCNLSQSWMKAGRTSLFRQIRCFFPTMRHMSAREGPCVFHWNRKCKLMLRPDHVDAGLPCTPFSVLRGDKTSTPPQKHKEFQALLDFVEYVERVAPHGGMVENVFGFTNKITNKSFVPGQWYALEMPVSRAAWLKGRLERLGYAVVVVKLDNALFCKVPRERMHLKLL